jgi:hypothetical protein
MNWFDLVISVVIIYFLYKVKFYIPKIYKFIELEFYKYFSIIRKKSLCNYCKYSVRVNNELMCKKDVKISFDYDDISILLKDCSIKNVNNKCKDYKFSWLWFIKS